RSPRRHAAAPDGAAPRAVGGGRRADVAPSARGGGVGGPRQEPRRLVPFGRRGLRQDIRPRAGELRAGLLGRLQLGAERRRHQGHRAVRQAARRDEHVGRAQEGRGGGARAPRGAGVRRRRVRRGDDRAHRRGVPGVRRGPPGDVPEARADDPPLRPVRRVRLHGRAHRRRRRDRGVRLGVHAAADVHPPRRPRRDEGHDARREPGRRHGLQERRAPGRGGERLRLVQGGEGRAPPREAVALQREQQEADDIRGRRRRPGAGRRRGQGHRDTRRRPRGHDHEERRKGRPERQQGRDGRARQAPPHGDQRQGHAGAQPGREQANRAEEGQGPAPGDRERAEAAVDRRHTGRRGRGELGSADQELRHAAVQAGEGREVGTRDERRRGGAGRGRCAGGVRGGVAEVEEGRGG
ncbi:hypothetical protein THAOC_03680, partial [Thalassiosira oceanica]